MYDETIELEPARSSQPGRAEAGPQDRVSLTKASWDSQTALPTMMAEKKTKSVAATAVAVLEPPAGGVRLTTDTTVEAGLDHGAVVLAASRAAQHTSTRA